jgi:hypothetical protein
MGCNSELADRVRTLLFLHIPKAGGSTLRQVLERHFRPDERLTIATGRPPWDQTSAMPASDRMRVRYVQGHLFYGLHRSFAQPSAYVTMLRDPVDRILSHYYYVLSLPTHYLHEAVASQTMSLKEYVASDLALELSNDQTRRLCGPPDVSHLTRDNLAQAKANMEEHFALVGLTDQFDETLVLARQLFGWRNLYYVRRNVTRARRPSEEVPQDVLDIIADRNRLDIELCKHAELTLANAIRSYGPTFRQDLARFQAINAGYQMLRASLRRGSAPVRLVRRVASTRGRLPWRQSIVH